MKRKVAKPKQQAAGRASTRSSSFRKERDSMAPGRREIENQAVIAAFDLLSTQIAMLDAKGNITATNKAWRDFSQLASETDRALPGQNYFEHCCRLGTASTYVAELSEGARVVIQGKRDEFILEYSCATTAGEKWFSARVTSCDVPGVAKVIITHDDISDRVELEGNIVAATERERQRFRKELHDGLSQHLTGLKFKVSLLEYHLESKNLAEASEAKALSGLLNAATEEASQVMRRLRPVEVEPRSLIMALRELAANTRRKHGVKCSVAIARPIFVHDNNVATNLFRLAVEAVESAADCGAAQKIQVLLKEDEKCVTLTVRDDGKSMAERTSDLFSAHIIRHHARLIGGRLEWNSKSPKGVAFSCCLQKRVPFTH